MTDYVLARAQIWAGASPGDGASHPHYGGWRRGLSGRDPDVLVSWAGVSSAARRGRSDRTGVARSRDIGRSESGDAVPYRARDCEASGSAVRLLKDGHGRTRIRSDAA